MSGLEGPLKGDMEDRSRRRTCRGGLVGVPDLAENLALARHQALQARGHTEEMADSGLSVVHNQVPGHLLARHRGNRGRNPTELIHFGWARLASRLNLDSVACRQDERA